MGPVRPALELGVGLGADPKRVPGQLDHLHQAAVGGLARALEAGVLEAGAVTGVHLVAVTVTLEDEARPSYIAAIWLPGRSLAG